MLELTSRKDKSWVFIYLSGSSVMYAVQCFMMFAATYLCKCANGLLHPNQIALSTHMFFDLIHHGSTVRRCCPDCFHTTAYAAIVSDQGT